MLSAATRTLALRLPLVLSQGLASLLVFLGLLALAGNARAQSSQPKSQDEKKGEEPPHFNEDIQVWSVSRAQETVNNAPATVTVVTSDTIAASPAQSVPDLLRNVPGLNVAQLSARDINLTSRQATGVLTNSQLALVDGRSIYLDFFGLILWDFVPTNMADIKQIEVVRGPASAVWGANALTGVVNIITKTPRETAHHDGTFNGSLKLTGGTFDRNAGTLAGQGAGTTYGASASISQAPNEHWSYRLSGGYFNSDPLSRPAGVVPVVKNPLDHTITDGGATYLSFKNQGTSQPKFDARVDQELANNAHITYSGGFAGTKGIIHTALGPFDIQSGSVLGYANIEYTRGAFKLRGFANIVDAKAPALLAVDPTGTPIQLNFKTQTYEFEIAHSRVVGANASATRGHFLSYGASARRNNFNITITPTAENRNEFGGYVQDEIFFDKFRLSLGGRLDKFGNLDHVVLSPRATAMFLPTKSHSIRVSFNKAFRSPSLINNYLDLKILQPVDLSGLAPLLPPPLRTFVTDPFPLVVRAEGSEVRRGLGIPPPDKLKEESLKAYEVAYTGTVAARTTVGLAFYINDTDDNIRFLTDPKRDPYSPASPPPGWRLPPVILAAMAQNGIFLPKSFTYVNLGPLRNKGIEVSVDHRFNEWLSGLANYSWQADPRSTDPNRPYPVDSISVAPHNRFNVGLSLNHGRYIGSASVNYADKAFWTDVLGSSFNGFTDSYAMVNASFGVKWASGKVTTSVKGTNLFNQTIQQHIFGDILKRSIVGEVRFAL
jgi:outer membrane receptor protein involved in Fe transport